MSCSSNLSLNAHSLLGSPAGRPAPRLLLPQKPPTVSHGAYTTCRTRRPSSHVTSAVSADKAPPTKEKKADSFVGDMERGTLAEDSGRSDGELTSRWREMHGCNDWAGLLDPIDRTLRGELIRYGEFSQACYDSFDYDRFSRYAGTCKYAQETFFKDVGLTGVGYEVARYLYATSHARFPSFGVQKHNPSDDRMWSETGTFIGFIAVSTDEETARIGRRDIAVAWRGTVTKLEWIADITAFLKPVGQFGLPCPDPSVKVEEGFAELYTSKNTDCKYCKYSAREQVLAEVRKLVERYTGQGEEVSVTVTGHSLGAALAVLCAYDIAETRANVSTTGAKAPVCVFSYSGPRVGNPRFRERFEGDLGVKALRILNVHDSVPKVPGIFTEAVLPMPLLRVAGALGLPSVYSHIGVELALDHRLSPFLKNVFDLACYHNLEAHLHLLDGYQGRGKEFKLGGRDPALVNKAADFLVDEHMVPPVWRQEFNKGLVRTEDGRWQLPHRPRHVEGHPEDTDLHLAELGVAAAVTANATAAATANVCAERSQLDEPPRPATGPRRVPIDWSTMKLQFLLVVALVALLVADVSAAEKVRKHKKGRKHRLSTTTTEQPAEAVVAAQVEQDVMTILAEDEKEEEKEASEQKAEEDVKMNEVVPHDPCQEKYCGAGKVCQVSASGEPECVCIPSCPIEVDPRRKVCSNHNETWGSDCEIYQMRCMCDHGSEMCKGEKYKHVHIEYYGVCREMRECSEEDMSDFPRRMRDWLFNVMRDLADRDELSPYFLKLEREAETNLTRRWTNAAIWKWCDLDGHPADRSVSRHELFPIRAPLMALEHCIAPFLNKCDADDDHLITLKEWGKCLELDEEDIEEKCDEVRGEEE